MNRNYKLNPNKIGHDQMRFFLFDQRTQRLGVGHVDDVGAVRHLLAGGIGIAVDGDHFHAQALQRDDDFLAEFACAEQHDPGGGWRERRAEFHAINPDGMEDLRILARRLGRRLEAETQLLRRPEHLLAAQAGRLDAHAVIRAIVHDQLHGRLCAAVRNDEGQIARRHLDGQAAPGLGEVFPLLRHAEEFALAVFDSVNLDIDAEAFLFGPRLGQVELDIAPVPFVESGLRLVTAGGEAAQQKNGKQRCLKSGMSH